MKNLKPKNDIKLNNFVNKINQKIYELENSEYDVDKINDIVAKMENYKNYLNNRKALSDRKALFDRKALSSRKDLSNSNLDKYCQSEVNHCHSEVTILLQEITNLTNDVKNLADQYNHSNCHSHDDHHHHNNCHNNDHHHHNNCHNNCHNNDNHHHNNCHNNDNHHHNNCHNDHYHHHNGGLSKNEKSQLQRLLNSFIRSMKNNINNLECQSNQILNNHKNTYTFNICGQCVSINI